MSNDFKAFLATNGIHHQQTFAYTPLQNSVFERMNRTLKDIIRAMLRHKNIYADFWAEALVTAAYVRNRVTIRSLQRKKTSFTYGLGKPPTYSHLRVFGSRCWNKIIHPSLQSLDDRACKAVMLGYATNQNAYKLWDTNKEEIVVSCDVKFQETGDLESYIGTADDMLAPDTS